jgi:subtilisin-like proprotein convertase family protein
MWSVARAVLMLVAGCLAACTASVDYDDTEYRCDRSGRCPDGFTCDDGVCQRAGDDDDNRGIDAGEDRFAMLRAESWRRIDIPDGFEQGAYDVVQFDASCRIADITVEVDISHEWVGDLVIELTAPSGTEVDLRDHSGGQGGEDLIGTYPTTLSPSESLDDFLGEDSAGVWILRVADVDDSDVGTLNGWAVNLWCDF